MTLFEVRGYYGSGKTPCTVYCALMRSGTTWYAVEDSVNVNLTREEIANGVNVEEVSDIDTFYRILSDQFTR